VARSTAPQLKGTPEITYCKCAKPNVVIEIAVHLIVADRTLEIDALMESGYIAPAEALHGASILNAAFVKRKAVRGWRQSHRLRCPNPQLIMAQMLKLKNPESNSQAMLLFSFTLCRAFWWDLGRNQNRPERNHKGSDSWARLHPALVLERPPGWPRPRQQLDNPATCKKPNGHSESNGMAKTASFIG